MAGLPWAAEHGGGAHAAPQARPSPQYRPLQGQNRAHARLTATPLRAMRCLPV